MKRGPGRLMVVAVLATALVSGALPAGAASSTTSTTVSRQREIDAELRRLRDQVGEATSNEAALLAELRVSQRRRKDLDARVAALDGSIAGARQDLADIDAAVARAIAAEASASAALVAARADLEQATDILQAQAVRAFIHFGSSRPRLLEAMSKVGVSEAPRLVALADAVAERQAAVVDEQRRLQEDTTRLEQEAVDAKAAVAAERDRITARKRQLESDRAGLAAATLAAEAEADEEQRLLGKVRAGRAEDERRIAQLERESSEIAALLRRRQARQGTTPSGKGVLGHPLDDPVVTSTFGHRAHPIYGETRLHAGVDFRGSTGTPIYAAAAGIVVTAGSHSGYGNTVVIDHGGSLATLYAHQSAISVSAGETVKRGQLIGAVGTTGLSTGPHLHFEVRVDGTPVDPLGYL